MIRRRTFLKQIATNVLTFCLGFCSALVLINSNGHLAKEKIRGGAVEFNRLKLNNINEYNYKAEPPVHVQAQDSPLTP